MSAHETYRDPEDGFTYCVQCTERTGDHVPASRCALDAARAEVESQEDVIQRLAPTCTCPEDLCLGEDGTCSACGQIDPEWDCLRTGGSE